MPPKCAVTSCQSPLPFCTQYRLRAEPFAYGKVAGNDDIVKMASPVAECLASLGVRSAGDLRQVTVEVYEERCSLTCVAAIRPRRHFGMVLEVRTREGPWGHHGATEC